MQRFGCGIDNDRIWPKPDPRVSGGQRESCHALSGLSGGNDYPLGG